MIAESTALLEKSRRSILDLIEKALYSINLRESTLKAICCVRFSLLGGMSLPKSHRSGHDQ